MATPTLIGMPEPPSNPDTPTDAPGTPNSTTTSISALSTIAIKDGHRGASFPHFHGGHQTSTSNTLEAERADRISRLAGLERVSTARPTPQHTSSGSFIPGGQGQGQIPGYFDAHGNPVYTTKMSTVGSASATGSVVSGGGRTTTWASGSTKGGDEDEMMSLSTNNDREIDERDRYERDSAMDMEDDDGLSDDTSLVGFGEGAGSTVSGPIYTRKDRIVGNLTGERSITRERVVDGAGEEGARPSGTETAEKIMRDRIEESDGRKPLGTPDEANLGKFYFEEKK